MQKIGEVYRPNFNISQSLPVKLSNLIFIANGNLFPEIRERRAEVRELREGKWNSISC